MKNKFSLIIPCYNEEKNLEFLIEKLKTINLSDCEIILVNNGSTDGTQIKLAQLKTLNEGLFEIVSLDRNIGYGNGIMHGVFHAKSEVIAWTHADLQTDPLDVLNAYELFISHPEFPKCILKGKRIGRSLTDSFFTFGMSIISSIFLKGFFSDVNAQPKMFHSVFLEKISTPPDDFSLDLYLLYQAKRNGFSIIEYPVFFHKRLHGQSKGGGSFKGKWKLIMRTFKYVLKLRKEVIH